MNPAGQNGIEMCHEVEGIGVVAADILEAIGEILAAREVLFEIREAAGERMPPHVDDLRAGQNELNQPHMAEVVGHLADEVWSIRLPLDSRAREKFLPEGFERGSIHCGENFRVR